MEELKKLYQVLSREGYYTKSFEDFKVQYEDSDYRDKVYGVVNRDGLYTKSRDDFESKYYKPQQEQLTPEMMETGQRNAAPEYAMTEDKFEAEKKKDGESPLQDGVSADVAEEPVVEEEVNQEDEPVAEEPVVEEGLSDVITPKLMGKEEQEVVPFLNYQFGDEGFKFERSGIGDAMVAKSIDDEGNVVSEEEFDLDPFLTSTEVSESKKLQKWMSSQRASRAEAGIMKRGESQLVKFRNREQIATTLEEFSKEQEAFAESNKGLIADNMKYQEDLDKYNSMVSDYNEANVYDAESEAKIKAEADRIQAERDRLVDIEQGVKSTIEGYQKRSDLLKRSVGSFDKYMEDIDTPTGPIDATRKFIGGFYDNMIRGVGEWAAGESTFYVETALNALPVESYVSPEIIEQQRKEGLSDSQIKDEAIRTFKKELLPAVRTGMEEIIGSDTTEEYVKDMEENNYVLGSILGAAKSTPIMALHLASALSPMPAGKGGKALTIGQRIKKAFTSPVSILSTKFMGAQVADALDQEMANSPAFEGVSENEKMLVKYPVAIVSGLLEEYGASSIVNKTGLPQKLTLEILKKMGKGASAKTFKEFAEKEIKSRAARGGITFISGMLSEFETGGLQELATVGAKKIYSLQKEQEMFPEMDEQGNYVDSPKILSMQMAGQILDAAAREAIGGGFFSTIPALSSALSNDYYFNSISDEQFELFNSLINTKEGKIGVINDLKNKITAGEITQEEGKRMLDDVNKIQAALDKIPSDYSAANKKKALSLIMRQDAIKKKIDGKDKRLTKREQKEIDKIDGLLDKVDDNNFYESEKDATVTDEEVLAELKSLKGASAHSQEEFDTTKEQLIKKKQEAKKAEVTDQEVIAELTTRGLAATKENQKQVRFELEQEKKEVAPAEEVDAAVEEKERGFFGKILDKVFKDKKIDEDVQLTEEQEEQGIQDVYDKQIKYLESQIEEFQKEGNSALEDVYKRNLEELKSESPRQYLERDLEVSKEMPRYYSKKASKKNSVNYNKQVVQESVDRIYQIEKLLGITATEQEVKARQDIIDSTPTQAELEAQQETKTEQDAIQEPSTEEVDVQEPARDSEAVGEGNVRETESYTVSVDKNTTTGLNTRGDVWKIDHIDGGRITFTKDGDNIKVGYAGLIDAEEGKGHGKSAYKALIEYAKKEGFKKIFSGKATSEKAARVWESLSKEYDVSKSEDGVYELSIDLTTKPKKDAVQKQEAADAPKIEPLTKEEAKSEEKVNKKTEQDAIQEPSTEEVDVQEPARDSEAVGEGDVRDTAEEVDTQDQSPEEASLEQQVKDLEALVSEQKVDFRLRADTDPDIVVDEVNQTIVDEMNDMEVVNAEIQFTTKEERKPIDANELNSRSNNDIKVVKIEDFDGVPFMFTISDQLTAGDAINPYTGEVITDLNGGIGFFSEDAAWANVNKDLADNQAKKAVSIYEANKEFFDNWWKQNPQYDGLVPMAVVKMGEQSILSNEAVARTLLQNMQKLPVKNRKKALSVLKKKGKERLKVLKKKEEGLKKQEKNLAPAEKHEVKLYEELFRFVKSDKPSKIDDILSRDFTKKIPLGARAILTKTIGVGNPNKPNQTKRVGAPKKGSVSAALIEGRPNEDRAAVSLSSIVEAITDPQMKDIEPRQVVAITGVDVRNAGAVKTNHKNYDWGVRGRLIGVLDKSIHATDAFPVTYNAAIRDVVSKESEGKRKSVGEVLSDNVPTQSGLSSSEFFAAKAKGNNQNAAKLFAFMNNAFPSVMMSTDKATFDNVMASEGVKKHLKGGEVVYGVTVGGDVYVNPDVHNSESQLFNTGIHEYGHVWTDYLQTTEKGKKLYARGVELVKQTEEYQKQLKIFNGDSKKAANEALAILIGNKGQSIADAAVNSKFQEFLLSMWKYIQSKFKLSEDLTIDEIQNLTLDEFIGTGLADIFSGKEIKLTDAQLKQLKNPEAAFSKNQSMQSIIDAGRANNFADSVIVELLKRKGYDIADINAAMGINAKKRVESIETLRKRIARMKDINEARELVAKEMRAILRDSGISKYSKRTVNKVITNLKNANVNNMQKMLDGVSESIQNDKDRVERAIRYKRRAAAIKKLKSMGALKDLQAPLISLFKTDPKYLSEQTRQMYDAIINDIVNVNKKFEDRMSKDELLSSVEKVVREYSNDLSRASSVAQRIENDIDTDISTKQNLDKLLKDGKISESEYELMTRFSDMLKESKEDTGLSEAEKLQKEEAKRQAVNDDFNEAMSSMPSKLDNLNDDEKKAFKFAQTLTEKDLEGLSLEAARRLVRGLEMLNAGIVSEYLLKGQVIVEGNRDGNSVPITEISESGIIDKTASKIRTAMSNLFKSSKRDKGKAVENRLRSVPLRNLDQVLRTAAKRFKSTGIYKNIFNPTAVAFESVKQNLKDIEKELQNATGLLSKNQNERFKQKAKLVMYQIQREFNSNPENKEVNPAKGWIEATLKDKDSIYDESEKKIIKDLMDEFLVNGEIDAQKIFDSFTDKEKRALKIIDNQYEKIQDMAEMDAAMQGLPFIKRQNYVHLPKVTNSESSMAKEFDDFAATLSNPSLKSKLLAQRSGRVHSISFDPIETAYSASRKTVTGYHMYPIVKRAKIAFANMRNRATTKAQNDIVDSLESIYDGIVRSQYQNVSKNNVAVENVINLMMKSGYLAQLASVRKAVVELTTNALHAAIANPINFVAGIKATSGIDRKTLDAAIKNLPTAEKTRITGDADLTSKDVESNLMTGSQIFKAEETTSDFMAAANVVGKAAKTIPQKIIEFNEGLVAKPDVIVARPLFVGVFNDKFKEITGQAPNWDKIANDKAYREKFEYAINEATFDADQAVVDSAASNNPFAGIPKNVRDQNASAIKQAVMLVDRYMTRFRVFEYYSALRGVQALMGRSDITRLQGAALLSATVLRMAAYKLAMDAAINMVYQALGIDDDEDELDKYDVSRQGLGAVVTLALGRGFGNLAQIPINYGVEYLNKEYGEGITREGDYNKYKDGVVYSKVSVAPESGDDIVADAVISSLGSYTPFAKTIARGGVLLTRGATSKKEETREKNMGEFYERIPFEVAGNLGVIPSYRDFRSIYLKNMAKEYKEMGDTSYEKLLKTIPSKKKKNTDDPFSYPDF